MDQSTFNHGKSGDTNPKGRSRSPLLELYTRSLRNGREEKIGHRTSAACGGRLRLCYTLDEGKESERETTNCPPKRVRSNTTCRTKDKTDSQALPSLSPATPPVASEHFLEVRESLIQSPGSSPLLAFALNSGSFPLPTLLGFIGHTSPSAIPNSPA